MAGRNPNGIGSVVYDKSRKQYRVALTDGLGRRHYKRFKTREEAEDWRINTLSEMTKGEFVAPSFMTLGEWLQEYLLVYRKPNVRVKTYVGYLHTAAVFTAIGDVRLQKLAPHALQAFYNEVDVGLNTKKKAHQLLKAALERAVFLGMIPKNPALGISLPTDTKKPIQIFSQEEIDKILKFLQDNIRLKRRFYPIVRTALETGMRLGEILGLKIHNVSNCKLTIDCGVTDVLGKPMEHPPKTQAGHRTLDISPELEKVLRDVYENTPGAIPNGYVFHTPTGTPLSTSTVGHTWHSFLTQAGIPYKNFHVIRHTFATRLLAEGFPLLEVAAYIGHSSPSHTLNLYGHSIPGKSKEIPAIMGKSLYKTVPKLCPNDKKSTCQ